MITRAEISQFLAGFYTAKMGGEVRSEFDPCKRAYSIQGSGLPAHPDMQRIYPNGWSLLDWISPAQARELMKGRNI